MYIYCNCVHLVGLYTYCKEMHGAYNVKLNPMKEVIFEKLIIFETVNNLPALYVNRSSAPCSQQPATCPCPEPDEPHRALQSICLTTLSILSSLLCLNLRSGVFPSGFDILTYTYIYTPHTLFINVIITITPSRSRSPKSSLLCSFPNTIPIIGTICFLKVFISHSHIFRVIPNSLTSVCILEQYMMTALYARKMTAFRCRHFGAELLYFTLFLFNL